MHAFKPYLDSHRSESDWSEFVVRFGVTYLMQKRFRPVFSLRLIAITVASNQMHQLLAMYMCDDLE